MKRLLFIVLASVFYFSVPAFSADWKSVGITVKSKKNVKDEVNLVVVDKKNRTFFVRYKSEPTQQIIEKISKLNNGFNLWKNMKIGKVSYVVENKIIKVVLIPKSFKYRNKNFVPHLTAGMMFIYEDNLVYNFRITNKRMFIRINGGFISEKKLSQSIYMAIVNPMVYLKRRDPSFFLRKLTKIEDSIIDQNKKYEKLVEKYNILSKKHEKLKYAVLTLNNEGFLGFGINKINIKAIQRILELRKSNPNISKDDLEKQLEKDNIKISGSEIELVLNVYYNEFK